MNDSDYSNQKLLKAEESNGSFYDHMNKSLSISYRNGSAVPNPQIVMVDNDFNKNVVRSILSELKDPIECKFFTDEVHALQLIN